MSKLTTEQGEQIRTWLNTKFKSNECPMCGATKWYCDDNVLELRDFDEGRLGETKHPVVSMVCSNCGNTVLLNALILGVIKKPGE